MPGFYDNLQRRRTQSVKVTPRLRGTIKGAPRGKSSSAVKRSPTPDDSTLVTSNLSKNRSIRRSVAPKIATLPDDDPPSLERLDDQHESSSDEDGDMHKEGRDDIQFCHPSMPSTSIFWQNLCSCLNILIG